MAQTHLREVDKAEYDCRIELYKETVAALSDTLNSKTTEINTLRNALNYEFPYLSEEFSSPDNSKSGRKMDTTVLGKYTKLTQYFGASVLKVNSAYRTRNHNSSVGGAEKSAHMSGKAIDVSTRDANGRPSKEKSFEIVKVAIELGFNRIGIHSNFIHVEYQKNKPSMIWLY